MNTELELRTLFAHPTVKELATQLTIDQRSTGFEVVLPLRSNGRHHPLFCFAPAAGIGWSYYRLLKYLDPQTPVYTVQARSLTEPEVFPQSLEEMSVDYADQVSAIQPEGPYCLLGWSFGGNIAHAVSTELQQRGKQTALLAMLDAYPADGSLEIPETIDQRGLLLGLIDGDADALGEGPVNIDQVIEVLRARGGPLSTLDAEQISAIVQTRMNNIRLAQTYTPQKFSGDLLLFTSTINRNRDLAYPELWEPYVSGTIETHDVVSDHDQLMQTESLNQFAPILAAKLRGLADDSSVASPES